MLKRGEIYFVAEKRRTVGSEQHGNRPAIIISNQRGIDTSNVVSCIYLTTAEKRKNFSVHVNINTSKEKSIALCEQVVPIDKSRIRNKIGEVTKEEMEQIERAIILSLDLSSNEPCKLLNENIPVFAKVNQEIKNILSIGHKIEEIDQMLSNINNININTGIGVLDVYISNELKDHIKEDIYDFLIQKRKDLMKTFLSIVENKEILELENTPTYIENETTKEEILEEGPILFIRENYTEGEMSLKDVAAHLNLTKKELYKVITDNNLKRKDYRD